MNNNLFTSEQVSCGHPDKMCDLIADSILTECLQQDKNSRVAIEVLMKNTDVVIAGELTTKASINYQQIVWDTLTRIGVDNLDHYRVQCLVDRQSPDIAMGVNTGGAGDQGLMFGYACEETDTYMPLAHAIATRALINLRAVKYPLLKPDAKAQVTFDYGKNRIDTFLISTQHDERITKEDLTLIILNVMDKTAEEFGLNHDFKALINPTGRFVIGGSIGDAGVTGRKIVADTYGGYAPHGGGAFSGKDPTKVDRSAAYMARYLAITTVKKFKTPSALIQLAYAIGVKSPVSVKVQTPIGAQFDERVAKYINKNYDLTPNGIINFLHLRDIDYTETTCYGHFGKPGLPWECYKCHDRDNQ